MTEISSLIEQLNQPEETLAIRQRLVAYGSASVEPLIAICESGSPLQTANAIVVLGEIGDRRAIDVLIRSLAHKSLLCRINAAQILGSFDDACVVQALLDHLPSAHELVQIWIVNSLGVIGNASCIKPLLDLLHQTASSSLRYMIIRALGDLGDPRTIADIMPYLEDDDHHVRYDARVALEKLGYNH